MGEKWEDTAPEKTGNETESAAQGWGGFDEPDDGAEDAWEGF